LKVVFFLLFPLLIFITWTTPTTKVNVVCGSYDFVAGRLIALVNDGSSFASSMGNGGQGVHLDSSFQDTSAQMSVACHEKVRKIYVIASNPDIYYRIYNNKD